MKIWILSLPNPFVSLTWKQIRKQIQAVAQGLINLGILKGDRIVILSENRPEWQVADIAIMAIGAISVPAYTTSTTNDYEHILIILERDVLSYHHITWL